MKPVSRRSLLAVSGGAALILGVITTRIFSGPGRLPIDPTKPLARHLDTSTLNGSEPISPTSRTPTLRPLTPVATPIATPGPTPIATLGPAPVASSRSTINSVSTERVSRVTVIPEEVPTTTQIPQEEPTPTNTLAPLPRSPLSGLLTSKSVASRRPMAVKIANDPGARPQWGISEAEVVFEHLTEGGVTRFTCLFLMSEAIRVGPIRSARLVDVDLITEFDALFAHVGGSPPVRQHLQALGPLDQDEFFYGPQGGPYFRTADRLAPHNVFINLAKFRDAGLETGLPETVALPPTIFYTSEPKIGTVTTITVPTRTNSVNTYQSRYEFDQEERVYNKFQANEPHIDGATGTQITVDNVIVQYTNIFETDYEEDFLGNKSLAIDTVGEGEALIFRDGLSLSGSWIRQNPRDRTRYYYGDGQPIMLRPGHTWIHLLAPNETIGTQ